MKLTKTKLKEIIREELVKEMGFKELVKQVDELKKELKKSDLSKKQRKDIETSIEHIESVLKYK
ncbi:MAG: hypothetical protein H8E13_12155 [Actinobacteria bacterium]|nr:hypothetical protein [Actinomycetota bacterium]